MSEYDGMGSVNINIGIYSNACPNCKGIISDYRLLRSLPCSKCLPEVPEGTSFEEVVNIMQRLGTLKEFKKLYDTEKVLKDMMEFFEKCLGSKPWSIQVMWLRRLVRNVSFAMIAPTGIGKTTFGIIMSMFYASRGYKSYIIVPTTALAMQIERKLNEFLSRCRELSISYLVIHSKLPKKERAVREERLCSSDGFHILVTTSRYLMRNYEKILNHTFKFIFVDDVDAVLRGSKAIDLILKLSGFNESDIELALKAVKLRRSLSGREFNEELFSIERELSKKRLSNDRIVIIASATGNPRGTRVKLFRELLGFEIGARPEFLRNVYDLYLTLREGEDLETQVVNIVKSLGSGGLVYVPIDKGVGYAEHIAKIINDHGIPAAVLHSKNINVINDFIDGKVHVLVGVATYYGVLVRGIDLPEIIRYAVFVGVPRHKIPLRLTDIRPQDVLRLLVILRGVVSDSNEKNELDKLILTLRKRFRRSLPEALSKAGEVLKGVKPPETLLEKDLLKAYEKIRMYLARSEIIDLIKKHEEVSVVEDGGELYVLIPDVATYLQASGRTSRLFVGGISRGISIVIVDDFRLLKGMEFRARWLIDDFKFIDVKSVDLSKLIAEVDGDRELIRSLKQGTIKISEITSSTKEVVEPRTVLLIVESPNKARTIARFFGQPSIREYHGLRVYEVSLGRYTLLITASGGHVYDLVSNIEEPDNIYGVTYERVNDKFKFIPIYAPIRRCLKCGYQFTEITNTCPICGSQEIKNSGEVINSLADAAYEVDEVYIGTDPDTEGEKIGYDIYVLLRPYARSIRRVEFHEVTRRAILNALNNPRDINLNLVKAQVVRRIEDRWLGFSLSALLQTDFWRRYCGEFGLSDPKCIEGYNRNLSAGRVQTPVLGWVVKRYEDYLGSKRKFLVFTLDGTYVELVLPKELEDISANDITKVIVDVVDSNVVEERVEPPPPYTTDTLLSDVASTLHIPVPKAMKLLQDLFETGFITYHRTDSTRVSDVGIAIAKEYLSNTLGSDFTRYYTPRSWSMEGAHECIRPTRPADAETITRLINEGIIEPVIRLGREHISIYNLIFNRFIASQSKAAVVRKQVMELSVSLTLSNGDVVKVTETPLKVENFIDVVFDGFMRFYKPLKIGGYIPLRRYELLHGNFRLIIKSVTQLLTQASLINMMKREGIGRPSTYAKIVETLFKRNYVLESRKRGYLIPTQLGSRVYYYLTEHFKTLVSENRTKELEKKMDLVESGNIDYVEVLNELYNELISYKELVGRKLIKVLA